MDYINRVTRKKQFEQKFYWNIWNGDIADYIKSNSKNRIRTPKKKIDKLIFQRDQRRYINKGDLIKHKVANVENISTDAEKGNNVVKSKYLNNHYLHCNPTSTSTQKNLYVKRYNSGNTISMKKLVTPQPKVKHIKPPVTAQLMEKHTLLSNKKAQKKRNCVYSTLLPSTGLRSNLEKRNQNKLKCCVGQTRKFPKSNSRTSCSMARFKTEQPQELGNYENFGNCTLERKAGTEFFSHFPQLSWIPKKYLFLDCMIGNTLNKFYMEEVSDSDEVDDQPLGYNKYHTLQSEIYILNDCVQPKIAKDMAVRKTYDDESVLIKSKNNLGTYSIHESGFFEECKVDNDTGIGLMHAEIDAKRSYPLSSLSNDNIQYCASNFSRNNHYIVDQLNTLPNKKLYNKIEDKGCSGQQKKEQDVEIDKFSFSNKKDDFPLKKCPIFLSLEQKHQNHNDLEHTAPRNSVPNHVPKVPNRTPPSTKPVELLKKELLTNLLQESSSRNQNSNSDNFSQKQFSHSNSTISQFSKLHATPLCVLEIAESDQYLSSHFENNSKSCHNLCYSGIARNVDSEINAEGSNSCNVSRKAITNQQLTYPTQYQNLITKKFTKHTVSKCDEFGVDESDKLKSISIKSSLGDAFNQLNACSRQKQPKRKSHYELKVIYKDKSSKALKKRNHSQKSLKYIYRKMSELTEESECCIRVAVRIRPQNSREKIDLCRVCTTVTAGEPQIVLGLDKAFTYDYVFDMNSAQRYIYETCVERLVDGALNGYNATVLAYGQTGSGKTFTMGTGFERGLNDDSIGIIPRAVQHIFSGIEELQSKSSDEDIGSTPLGALQFSVAVQFIELYNEDIVDLLDPYSKDRHFKIHENSNREITISGATTKPIHSPKDALKCLQQGALARTTASTKMNDQSSRSHALFTILIRRQRVLPENDLETLTSKFNFVDLAGSERLKRTGATGERAREGISINCGLLALGNCISSLGDISKKATHVPYRDSKLTRLLQDSLGGNSQTLMIACVSPSDRDFMETLNTLKYANRARNIKNRVQVNTDQSSRTICQLRREIAALQLELLEFKQGKRNADGDGSSSLTDTFHENAMLLSDNKRLKQRIKSLQETIDVLTEKNVQLRIEKDTHGWTPSVDSDNSVTSMIAGYLSEIEKLQAKLIESEEMYQQLKKSCNNNMFSPRGVSKINSGYENAEDLINLAKREIEKDRDLITKSNPPENSNNCSSIENNENNPSDSDDTDTESEEKASEMQADLIDINSDIEIKTKLIEQLELSQKRMELMRQHYEEKLDVLNSKILNTQKERDDVLSNMSTKHGNVPTDQVKKVRDEYERKINDMHREMKKLQQAQREHSRQQREMQAQEAKLRNLRAELDELKSSKTRLMRKIADQTSRHKEEDTRRIREIAQLRKEQRKQQNEVKSLQAKMQAKDQILKRKTEEVTALRRNQKGGLSHRAAGRVNKKDYLGSFNTKVARQRWDNIFRSISRAARNKQLVMQLEQELERLMRERDDLSHELANVRNRQRATKNRELANEEDTIKSNLNYVQENIATVQQSIMECEEGKDTTYIETSSLPEIIQSIKSLDEAAYLIERLTNTAVTLTCNFSLMQSRLQEHETMLKEVQQESGIQQQLLQHFLAQNNAVKISDLFDSLNLGTCNLTNSSNFKSSQVSLHSNDTYDIPPAEGTAITCLADATAKSRSQSPVSPMVDLCNEKNGKIRRRTAQPQDLLFGDSENNTMTKSCTQQEALNRINFPLMRVPSAPGSLKQSVTSSSNAKRNSEMNPSLFVPISPRSSRKGKANKTIPGL